MAEGNHLQAAHSPEELHADRPADPQPDPRRDPEGRCPAAPRTGPRAAVRRLPGQHARGAERPGDARPHRVPGRAGQLHQGRRQRRHDRRRAAADAAAGSRSLRDLRGAARDGAQPRRPSRRSAPRTRSANGSRRTWSGCGSWGPASCAEARPAARPSRSTWRRTASSTSRSSRAAHNHVLFTVFAGVNLMMKETHWKAHEEQGPARSGERRGVRGRARGHPRGDPRPGREGGRARGAEAPRAC